MPSSNRLNTGEKLIITSSFTKDVYRRTCIKHWSGTLCKCTPLKSGLFTSTLVLGSAIFLIITGGLKDFMFRNEKFLGFAHPYNLLEYFQHKETDSHKTLQKGQYTNRSIKEQQLLNRGSNKSYCSHWERRYRFCPLLSWKLKRGRTSTPTSSTFELFC